MQARARTRGLGTCDMHRHVLRGDRLDMPSAHHTPALSPSRLMLYRQCPALYKRRYVDGIKDPATIDMEYGHALHSAIEAHQNGQDATLVFLRELKQRVAGLPNCEPADWLVPQGLRLLEDVVKLGYSGEAERKFIFAYSGFRVPFRGIIDLWMPRPGIIVDWKTTRRPWTEKAAENYLLQRAVYMQAITSLEHKPATFQFVALGAYPGGFLQVVEATPTPDEIDAAFELAYGLYLGIESEQWECTCKSGEHRAQAA